MQYTLDLLMGQVNEVANRPSIEDLRITCTLLVRSTLLEIGKELTCAENVEQIYLRDHRYAIPSRIIKIDDVGLQRDKWRGSLLMLDQHTYDRLGYSDRKDHLYFPNLSEGPMWIQAWVLPVDAVGSPLIPEQAFNACYAACLSRIVSTTPASPHWQDRISYRNDVQVQIRIARGLLNEHTKSRLRSNRNPLINNGHIQ